MNIKVDWKFILVAGFLLGVAVVSLGGRLAGFNIGIVNIEVPTAQQSFITPVSNPQPGTIYNCLIYNGPGKGLTWEMDIDVQAEEIAFIDAWGFDDRSGGVFVTITGPYKGHHVIHDGAFCGGIPTDANHEPVKQQRLNQMHEPFQRLSLP